MRPGGAATTRGAKGATGDGGVAVVTAVVAGGGSAVALVKSAWGSRFVDYWREVCTRLRGRAHPVRVAGQLPQSQPHTKRRIGSMDTDTWAWAHGHKHMAMAIAMVMAMAMSMWA